MELTAPTPTPGALPQVTSLPNSGQNSLLLRAGRRPTHEPFTPQRHSRIPHQTLRWPTPHFRVTKDGSPHRQAPRPGVQAGGVPPQPLSSVLSATQGLQEHWLADQYRVPPPPSKPDPSPEHALLPPDSPTGSQRVSSQALPAALLASPSRLAAGPTLPQPSYSGPQVKRPPTTPRPAQPRAARPHRPGCCTSRLALPSTAAPAPSTRPVSPELPATL